MFQAAKKTSKISDQIIDQIRDAILSGKLKPGVRLASEKELADQFGVSKATMREAMRVLEVLGLIEIRKGLGGGIFIAEVGMRTTIHSIINFLHFQTLSIQEITMLRYLIEPTVARIAASKITDKDIENLKKIVGEKPSGSADEVSKEIGFHRYLARMAENTLLILIVDFVDNLLDSIKSKVKPGPDFYRDVRKSHQKILECLIKKDAPGAEMAMTQDLLEVDQYLCRVIGSAPFDPTKLSRPKAFKDDNKSKGIAPRFEKKDLAVSGKKAARKSKGESKRSDNMADLPVNFKLVAKKKVTRIEKLKSLV
ncbi:MAG: FadR family transcriptional regulator [Deltaproteobacteria bacterium]|nr:FadR family transcriptional regulator [Deltaproteobacteria bacterium]